MKITRALSLVALILALASAQTFVGGVLPNLEAGQVTVFPSATVNQEGFTHVLSRTDAFTSTAQDFLIATGTLSSYISVN